MKLAVLRHKARSFLLWVGTKRFGILRLSELRPVRSPVPIGIERYSDECMCSQEVLVSVKGRSVDWERRWSRGHVCYLAIAGGKPVAYLWIAFDGWRAVDAEDAHPLPESAAFMYDVVTMAAWRGKSILPALVFAAATSLAGSGYSELYGLVDDRNIASQRALRKVGVEYTDKTVKTYRVLKLVRIRRSDDLV